MSNHHSKHKSLRHGSTLEHGEAHSIDHQNWNRRQFLSMGSIFAAGSLLLKSTPVNALMPNTFTNALSNTNTDNILVLIRLHGGNDGLNTIIPHSTDIGRTLYESYRPVMKLMHNTHYTDNQILSGYNHTSGSNSNSQFAIPTQMDSLMNLWNNDKMSIIHNVGHDAPHLSHFKSMDYWSTGTNDDISGVFESGWMGRLLDYQLPCYDIQRPNTPPAIIIGNATDLTFMSPEGTNMALTFTDVEEFNTLVLSGQLYPNIPNSTNCAADIERDYLRSVANNGFTYNAAIQNAYGASSNINACYPAGNELADQLSIVARLIKGNLDTRIYMVTLGGFDFHVGQMANHQNLLGKLSEAMNCFYEDIADTGHQEKVITMAYSEFGRTVKDNGSGTDHGNLGPVMLFGDGLSGGFHGTPMDLEDPSLVYSGWQSANVNNQPVIDYRSIYATLLEDWLGLHPEIVNCMFAGEAFDRIPYLIENPNTAATSTFENAATLGHNIHPENAGIVQVKYAIKQECNVKVCILNQSGGLVWTLENGEKDRDAYTIDFDWQSNMIQPGEYICQMQYGSAIKQRKLILQ